MKKYLFILFSVLSLSALAQQRTVTGSVISGVDNEPLIGVSILIKGTTQATTTDAYGNFRLPDAPDNGVITFSMLGFKTQEIPVNGRTTINVTLQEETKLMDEIVVVGYGAVKRSDLTSSISTVKGDDLRSMASGNAMYALQGKANGIQITNAGGPGATPRVIIRGVTTVNGSDPLYVVDGMPVGSNINFLNQDDIESMEILKDASAAAIYGTRGSNGVILITTRKGSVGKVQFQVNSSVGLQTLKNPNVAQAEEYERVFKQRYINDGNVPVWNSKDNITNAEGTDWWN